MRDRRATCPLVAVLVFAALFAAGCAPPPADEAELRVLFEEAWEFELAEDPLRATAVGRHEYDDRLPSAAATDLARRDAYWRAALERLQGIDRDALSVDDRISYDLFERQVSDRLAAYEFKEHLVPITAESGFHTDFARLPERVPLATVADYENYLARLEAFPAWAAQQQALMRDGIAGGYVLPRAVLEGYEATIDPHLVAEVEDSVFWQPLENFPPTVPEAARPRLRERGERAILERVVPAYRGFREFLLGEYVPAGRETLGASELPRGGEYYQHLIRHHTTLDLSAEEVHEIGRSEVERILAEMRQVMERVGHRGELDGFLERLRTEARFFAADGEELLMRAAWIAKRMDGKLPALFRTLPRLPYGVEPVPEHLAPRYTAGRYVPAPQGSTRPGYYWVNTYALESRPLWALTALTLHEAVPGHHLQNALRQELEGLPEFRRFSGINAYGEGWALYAEWLGVETGMYEDPYDDFGRLTYEMWRACRLVVDTGLHAFGWTRQQARDYLAAHTALSRHEIATETDRYISWAGQALAYKLGELKIKELRRLAEETLGAEFDLREFHDVVLLAGPLPLTVLEAQVRAWLEGR